MADKMQELRELIRENRFAEARQILKMINHPKKAEWLAKLDEREAAYNPLPALELKTSTLTNKALPKIENPPTSNLFGIIFRVLLGGLVAFVLMPIAMILLDTQVLHLSEFLMDEESRRVFRFVGAFLAISGFLFAFLARLIANAADISAGVYYCLLFALVIVIWHYGSFYVSNSDMMRLPAPIDSESFMAYWNHLDALPADHVMSIGFGIMIAFPVVYTWGAVSIKELGERLKEEERRMHRA
jgi:hypothetical protein